MSRLRQILRWGTPFVVTVGGLWWVFSRIGLGAVAEQLTPDALWLLIPAILAFGIIAVAIEAECLVRLLPDSRDVLSRGTAARIKAASYPLSLVHYALGAGALVAPEPVTGELTRAVERADADENPLGGGEVKIREKVEPVGPFFDIDDVVVEHLESGPVFTEYQEGGLPDGAGRQLDPRIDSAGAFSCPSRPDRTLLPSAVASARSASSGTAGPSPSWIKIASDGSPHPGVTNSEAARAPLAPMTPRR